MELADCLQTVSGRVVRLRLLRRSAATPVPEVSTVCCALGSPRWPMVLIAVAGWPMCRVFGLTALQLVPPLKRELIGKLALI